MDHVRAGAACLSTRRLLLCADAHVPVGGTPLDYEEMARSCGDLHWAGEATNRAYPCTVDGAHRTGEREGAKVVRKLRQRLRGGNVLARKQRDRKAAGVV